MSKHGKKSVGKVSNKASDGSRKAAPKNTEAAECSLHKECGMVGVCRKLSYTAISKVQCLHTVMFLSSFVYMLMYVSHISCF